MGVFDSIRRGSSSFKDTSFIRPTRSRTTTTTSTGYSSRYSSAPTSRCPSPISRTRSDELSSIISRSVQYPIPTSTASPGEPKSSQSMDLSLARIRSNFSSLSTKLKSHKQLDLNLNQDQKKKGGPEGFRSFVQNAKNQNPNYRKEKLQIMKPVSSKDGFGWLMDRKRNDWVDE
ncbi:hypothetical protein V865_002943 [Kwoniella europaea PYCC6329]|uniref:Uncharacterized protein n=1 Tax=Kwoniella europaea PYCC6329 TaxID=1423913 RepID=A0AAX4KEN1_9TREE